MGNTKLVVANVYKSESRSGGKFVREGAKLIFSEKLVSRDNAVICNEDDRNPRFYDIDEEATKHYYEVIVPEQAERRRLESEKRKISAEDLVAAMINASNKVAEEPKKAPAKRGRKAKTDKTEDSNNESPE